MQRPPVVAALAGLLLLGACTRADAPTGALRPGDVRLSVHASVAAAQEERLVEIVVAYRRADGSWVPLPTEPSRVALLAGAAVLPVVVLACRAWFRRRLGGYTGDALGCAEQVAEIAFGLAMLAALA